MNHTIHSYFFAGIDWAITHGDDLYFFRGFQYDTLDDAQAAVRRHCYHKGL